MKLPEPCFCENCIPQRPVIGLDDWRAAMCMNEYFFWQLCQDMYEYPDSPLVIDPTTLCDEVVYERFVQGGKIAGRQEIWANIVRADQMVHELFNERAGYYPTPRYVCDEINLWGCPAQQPRRIELKHGRLIALGAEAFEDIAEVEINGVDGDGVPLHIADDNYDDIWDTVTFELETGVCAEEILVFFPAEYSAYPKDFWRNEIRQACVEQDGDGKVKVTIPAWLLIKPRLYMGMRQVCYDPNDIAAYVPSVKLIRRYTDDSNAVKVWRQPQANCCEPATCLTCEEASACIISNRNSVIEITPPRCGCKKQSCALEKICVCYLAGDCLDAGIVVARLAAAFIGKNVCCAQNTELGRWQGDLVGVDEKGRIVSSLDEVEKGNPLGTRVGSIEAWKFTQMPKKKLSVANILFA